MKIIALSLAQPAGLSYHGLLRGPLLRLRLYTGPYHHGYIKFNFTSTLLDSCDQWSTGCEGMRDWFLWFHNCWSIHWSLLPSSIFLVSHSLSTPAIHWHKSLCQSDWAYYLGMSCVIAECNTWSLSQVYDWLLTTDSELTHVWSRRWGIIEILYIITRYLPFVDTPVMLIYREDPIVISWCCSSWITCYNTDFYLVNPSIETCHVALTAQVCKWLQNDLVSTTRLLTCCSDVWLRIRHIST
jgi:hypothetical protein